jgi:signal transduction histidine kinase
VRIGWSPPPRVETNARVGYFDLDGRRLYFFPDRILVYSAGQVGSVSYKDLSAHCGTVRFVEDGTVPSDARVVGRTWRYVNKDGGPDRRFNNNFQMPVAEYGVLQISATPGLNLQLQTSRADLASGAAELFRVIRSAIEEMESRPPATEPAISIQETGSAPETTAVPEVRLLVAVLDLLSFRWLSALPDWAAPIGWGLVLAMPAGALVARLVGGATSMPGPLLCAIFLLGGGGIGGLCYEVLRSGRERRAQELEAMRSRFYSLLAHELRTCPVREFSFTRLIEESGVPQAVADHAADKLYRRVADRVMEDGVITEAERRRLERLGHALEMGRGRVARIEAEAKADRYRVAVADALADGVVTEEEARTLNQLRASLDVDDDPWQAGDVVTRMKALESSSAAGKEGVS